MCVQKIAGQVLTTYLELLKRKSPSLKDSLTSIFSQFQIVQQKRIFQSSTLKVILCFFYVIVDAFNHWTAEWLVISSSFNRSISSRVKTTRAIVYLKLFNNLFEKRKRKDTERKLRHIKAQNCKIKSVLIKIIQNAELWEIKWRNDTNMLDVRIKAIFIKESKKKFIDSIFNPRP